MEYCCSASSKRVGMEGNILGVGSTPEVCRKERKQGAGERGHNGLDTMENIENRSRHCYLCGVIRARELWATIRRATIRTIDSARGWKEGKWEGGLEGLALFISK